MPIKKIKVEHNNKLLFSESLGVSKERFNEMSEKIQYLQIKIANGSIEPNRPKTMEWFLNEVNPKNEAELVLAGFHYGIEEGKGLQRKADEDASSSANTAQPANQNPSITPLPGKKYES